MLDNYDVAIIGGGMVGLALAAALSRAHFSVAVIESQVPRLHWSLQDYDARVSAIHLGTQAFLEHLSVWAAIRPSSYSPLQCMEVWDSLGGGRIIFDASDIQQDVLGYIVENREIVRVLWEYCEAQDNISLLSGITPQAIYENQITLSDHHTIQADLVVGADGARSWLRESMKIEWIEKPYHHDALVAVIETEKPHFCKAYQPFLTTGPLGVLPLSNPHHVAIVWSANPTRAEELLLMPLDDFDRELMNALNVSLGEMHCLSQRKNIPLVQRYAKRYVQNNKVLVGDAAHTIHPLAGQGANLGFMDVACLAKILREAKNDRHNINDHKVLRRYERWRKSENQCMMMVMSGFKMIFSDASPITVSLRSAGLNTVNRADFLKRCFMRYAVHQDFP